MDTFEPGQDSAPDVDTTVDSGSGVLAGLDVNELRQQKEEFVGKIIQEAATNGVLEGLAAEGYSADEIQSIIEQSMGSAVPVDDFDIHEIHLEEHNRYRMSQEYETLPDEVKQEFQKHVQQHEQFLQQAIAMQMMMQAGPAAGGAPGGEDQGALPSGDEGQETPGPEPMPATMGPTA